MPRRSLFIIPLALALLGQGCFSSTTPAQEPVAAIPRESAPTPNSPLPTPEPIREPEVLATNLTIPWDIAFLPAGDMLVTERTGELIGLTRDGTVIPIKGVPDVHINGEGGLLGVLLDQNYVNTRQLYLYFTFTQNGRALCRVDRYMLDGDMLINQQEIIGGIPCAIYHDGGRMAWGPDGKLYITTGDATQERLAQDKDSLAGKILRLNADGTIPDDNPFGTAVWSYGHRNPQGIAWDDQGRLWETEHGRSGLSSGYDELNLIEPGKNYGWPTIQGPETRDGMESPKLQSGPTTTWAPASAQYWNGSIFFGGLRGEALYEADITQDPPVLKEHFKNTYGRIRTVRLGPDGMLYLTTSNRDGRGTVQPNDDKIIRIDPRMFRE